jgi:hypothetical protein
MTEGELTQESKVEEQKASIAGRGKLRPVPNLRFYKRWARCSIESIFSYQPTSQNC